MVTFLSGTLQNVPSILGFEMIFREDYNKSLDESSLNIISNPAIGTFRDVPSFNSYMTLFFALSVQATTPRKPFAKEVVIRPAPVISSKEKSTPPLPSSSSSSTLSSTSTVSSGGGVSSQSPSPATPSKDVSSNQSFSIN